MSQIDGVLFSESGAEVTIQDLIFTDEIPPLFSGNKVIGPKPLVAEGTYYVYDLYSDKYIKRVITKQDLEKYFRNATRDVAVNYEHDRTSGVKGWVRLRDTKYLGEIQTPDGPKTAIFAAIELMPEAAELVAKGYYRDVSIELKPISYEITGLALTAYPVIRHLQFYSDTQTASEEEGLKEPTQYNEGATMDKETLLSEALQAYGLTPEDLARLPELLAKAKEAERQAEEARRQARFAQLRVELEQKVVKDGLKVAPGALDALAALYLYAEEHEVKFSMDDRQTDLKGLLDEVLAGIEAVSVFGETGAAQLKPNPEPSGVNKERVEEIVNIAIRRLSDNL
ncbi:hypothetical protein [Thermus phage P23-45]|uniref:Capsid scaffolding protein n=1 Tax=Thermus virus P23-45 TaxID=2914006 RepID=A7XXC0_BP234|nr:head maturation protease [Thermus phage P23-45]ABU96920.1 capsid scaffolding protein [Thermus phage P23-45]UYB98504.1 hypothetical protein [Thermus phage P23-45]